MLSQRGDGGDLLCLFDMQRDQLRHLLAAKGEDGARAVETVKVQMKSHLVSGHYHKHTHTHTLLLIDYS